ncbi:MAG: DeoR family transcriptional regulator, partial [Lachnospiraceae bacterium]|nr:DeoR family transcriptional regulator [Lachnospiraceae bacterium]
MLTEERQSLLLEAVNRNHSIGLNELCQILQSSESTVRRDLNFLAEKGLLTKVRGGAMALDEKFTPIERNMDEKAVLIIQEKDPIARYAASFVQNRQVSY